MPYTLTAFIYRKPGTTPSEFKTYYEKTHVPLFRSFAGDTFPLSYTRHYILRDAEKGHEAVTLMGSAEEFQYDAFAELVFENEGKFLEMLARVSEPEVVAKLQADKEVFQVVGRERVVVVGEVVVSRK